ncbi:MAG: hypothetical protein EAZ91_03250 [Cytophagales bacterium]|nr:MAG: hypothetical protein EAZ91_03250 [Cytophagales bacterium]
MKLFFTLICCLWSVLCVAQEFKPFKVNTSIGYARPARSTSAGGVLIGVEPKYGLSDHLDIGLRIEGAIMGRTLELLNWASETRLQFSGSYVLTGTYLFTTTDFRPYAGLGVGFFRTGGMRLGEDQSILLSASHKPGGMVRAGFKYDHFNFGLDYNIVPTSKYLMDVAPAKTATAKSFNSYLGVRIGFDIGGGWY